MEMLLEHKVTVIDSAGGPIGGAFASKGARIFLAGRTKAKLDTRADAIRAHGGLADTAVVDARAAQAEMFWLVTVFGFDKGRSFRQTRYRF